MLPEQKDSIYKHFRELVQQCDLKKLSKTFIDDDIWSTIPFEGNKYHDNRCILFRILEYKKSNLFPKLIELLIQNGFKDLSDALQGTKIIKNINNKLVLTKSNHPLDLNINVKLSTKFYDSIKYNKTGFYSTRSKNRGHVLIINNIKFLNEEDNRNGAEIDEQNLKLLFQQMNLTVTAYTNLDSNAMYYKAREFAHSVPKIKPDMAFIIIMSHGIVVNNETLILSCDNKFIPEDAFRNIFNNEQCALFRNTPKILIYHICRNIYKMPEDPEVMTDGRLLVAKRTYSDMLICHPSVKGFQAHRNNMKGSWYIQMLCKVFMNHAYEMDVESLLKKLDEELEKVSSLPWNINNKVQIAEQTSTYQNIAFKKCYIHPGIYEEDGKIMHFNQFE